jgi:hypothetical protein
VLSVQLQRHRVGRGPVTKVRDGGVARHEVGEDESHHRHPKAEKHQSDETPPYEEEEWMLGATLCERRSQ